MRIEGVEVFGRHVGQGAADQGALNFAHARAGIGMSLDGQVEVEQHRRAIFGQQNVRGFQVTVEQSPSVGVVESLGQPRHDPDGGLDGAGALEESPRGLVADRRSMTAGCGVLAMPGQRNQENRLADAIRWTVVVAEFPGDSVEALSCDRNDGTGRGIRTHSTGRAGRLRLI